jgi:selenium metabolism protein YedF
MSVVFLRHDVIGIEDRDIGKTLMEKFLGELNEQDNRPETIILMNSGVKLATMGSFALSLLAALQGHGVNILACSTCLSFLGLLDSLEVGNKSNMKEITQTLLSADLVITI